MCEVVQGPIYCSETTCHPGVSYAVYTQDKARQVSLRLVGCGFSLVHVAFQRLAVVSTCLGEGGSRSGSGQDIRYTYGYGQAIPDACNAYEVGEGHVFS